MPETTDPTFYRSPAAAIAAPPEQLAYVAAFDPAGEQRDAMTVVDCDAGSPSYGEVVGWTELPTAGNELHHFGWNACSSALCHEGHDGALERRYLIVPGLRSSRTYVLDTGPDPRQPQIVRTIEPEELAEKAGYSRPHTVHCGPGRHLHVQPGRRQRRWRPGRRGADRPRHLRGHRRVGDRPWRAALRVRRLVAPERGRGDHVGVGDPVDDRGRVEPRGPAGKAVRPPPRLLEPLRGQADPAGRPGRRAPDGARAEARSRPAEDVGLRRGGDQRRGSVRVGVAVAPRGRPVGGEEGDHHSRRAGRDRPAPARAPALRRGSAARDRHRPVRRRSLAVRVVLGDRRAQAVRRERPAQPEGGGVGAPGRDRRAAPRTRPLPSCRWPARPRWWR